MGYLTVAIVMLSIVGACAIISLQMHTDKIEPVVIVIGFLSPTIAALVAVLKGYQNGSDIKDLHRSVDGRMTQLLEQTAVAATLSERATPNEATVPSPLAVATKKID